MNSDPTEAILDRVDQRCIRKTVFSISADCLPFRKANYTIPGHVRNTLEEADDLVQAALEAAGYGVSREACRVQAFRCDTSKPKSSQYSPPMPEDPWYDACNLHAAKCGIVRPDEIITVVAHKDSPSWVDSPGAYDNAVGTAAALEIARVLAEYPLQRSVRFLFCNEEHTPWTSVTAAGNARQRGDDIISVVNLDSLGGKSQEDVDAGIMRNSVGFCTPEGEALADLAMELNDRYSLGLAQSKYRSPAPGNDDGSFVNAGYPAAIICVGSMPFAEPNYHAEGDTPDRVDFDNVAATTRLALALLLDLDRHGVPAPGGGAA